MTATLIIWLTWRYIHTYWLPRIEVDTTKKALAMLRPRDWVNADVST